MPFMYTYVRKGKPSFWTFAVKTKDLKIVFEVPQGTISRDVKLD